MSDETKSESKVSETRHENSSDANPTENQVSENTLQKSWGAQGSSTSTDELLNQFHGSLFDVSTPPDAPKGTETQPQSPASSNSSENK